MSFMYNPFPFHDPKPVNRPELSQKTVESIVGGGNPVVAKRFMQAIAPKVEKEGAIVAFDGYTTTKWDLLVSLLARECDVFGFKIEFVDSYKRTFKSGEEIDAIIDPLLIWDKKIDPTLLYGKVYHGGYIGLMDPAKVEAFKKEIPALKAPGTLVVVYGYGSLIKEFRDVYDIKCWFDITPMNSMLRIRAGEYSNLGKKHTGIINRTIRRCYYCDFENAVQRQEQPANDAVLQFCRHLRPTGKIPLPRQALLSGGRLGRQLYEETAQASGTDAQRCLGIRLHSHGGERDGGGRIGDARHQLLLVRS